MIYLEHQFCTIDTEATENTQDNNPGLLLYSIIQELESAAKSNTKKLILISTECAPLFNPITQKTEIHIFVTYSMQSALLAQ